MQHEIEKDQDGGDHAGDQAEPLFDEFADWLAVDLQERGQQEEAGAARYDCSHDEEAEIDICDAGQIVTT